MTARTETSSSRTIPFSQDQVSPSVGKNIEEMLSALLAMIECRAVFLLREAAETYAPKVVWGLIAGILGAIFLGNLIFGVVVQGLSLLLTSTMNLSADVARLWVLAVLTIAGLGSVYAVVRAKIPSRD